MVARPTWKTQTQLKSFSLFHRRAKVEVFPKYNTGIPSSTGIERVFSVGPNIMKPNRATLLSENFDRFIFEKTKSV